MVDLIVRNAVETDLEALQAFFVAQASDALPAPPLRQVQDAILDRQLMLVLDEQNAIQATGGVFPISSPNWPGYAVELAGDSARDPVRGLRPFRIQRVLIALRLLRLAFAAATSPTGSAAHVLALVLSGNAASETNLLATGFSALDRLSPALAYDLRSWSDPKQQWRHLYVPGAACVGPVVDILGEAARTGELTLDRINRDTGAPERFTLRIRLAWLPLALGLLDAMAAGTWAPAWDRPG